MHKQSTAPGKPWIWIGVIPAMILPAIAAVFYFWLFPRARIAWGVYTGTKVFTLIWPVVAMIALEGARPRVGRLDWRRHVRAIPLGLVTGAAIGGLAILLFHYTPVGEYVGAHADAIRAKVRQLDLARYFVTYAIFLSVAHSLIEEYFWRWYVFGRLDRVMPRGAAVALASLAFAAHHYVVLGSYFPVAGTLLFGTCVGIGGAIWCVMYIRQQSVAGAWVSHMLVDMAIFSIGYAIVFAV